MHVVTFLNEKGGVGKSTCAATFACGMALIGYRVLLIDADPQGKLADAFGLKSAPHFHDFVMRDTPIEQLIVPVDRERIGPPGEGFGALWLMPGNYETRSINDGTNDLLILLKKLAALRDRFDIVIIDTQPTPALLHSVIFLASSGVIFPTELTRPALVGVASTWANLRENSALRESRGLPPVKLLGVVPIKTRLKTNDQNRHGKNVQAKHSRELGAAFKNRVWDAIPFRAVWEDAASAQKSIFAYAPNDKAAESAWGLVRKVQEVLGIGRE